ncbi:MAG: CoA-binding protein [Candidatus Geothermincolia bacterium]
MTAPFDFDRIDSIINARSIAVLGASNNPGKFGFMLTAAQLAMEFEGPIYLVNPREKEIMGRPSYPDIASLPEPVDLVYVTIPAVTAMDALRQCAASGVKGVVMIASGFSEAGEEGRALQEQALALARECGFRLIGPNCFGIYNPRNRMTLLPGYDFSRTPGDIGYISQSGGFSVHVGRLGKSLGLDFSAIVSYGNGADLDEVDLLRYFARDPQTAYIGGYLEGVKDGRAFLAALREAAAAKPTVLWKVGAAEPSRRAVASHTGSLAGSAEIWEAAVRQAGAVIASGVDETIDVLLAWKTLGTGFGRRLLIAGGGGGLGTYGADLADAEGLQVPLLSDDTMDALRVSLARAGAVPGNPLDIGAPLIPLDQFEPTLREAARDRETDVLVFDLAVNFAHAIGGEEGLEKAADILIDSCREAGKPLVMVLYSRNCDAEDLTLERITRGLRDRFLAAGVPVYPSLARAMRALALANR